MTSTAKITSPNISLLSYQSNMEKLIFVLDQLNEEIQKHCVATDPEARKLYLYHARQHQETAAKLVTTLIPPTL